MVPEKVSLTTTPEDMVDSILEETDIDDLNDIIKLFNINLKKRNLIRSSKLSEVQDKVVEQIASRVEDRPDNFSNEDLLKYYKTIQDTLNRADSSLDDMEVPTIQVNQQINVGTNEFDRDSRKRILDTVNQILKTAKDTSSTVEEVIDVDSEVIDERKWHFD